MCSGAYFEKVILGERPFLGSLGCLNHLRSKLTCRCNPKLHRQRVHCNYDNLDLAKNGFVGCCCGIDQSPVLPKRALEEHSKHPLARKRCLSSVLKLEEIKVIPIA